MPQSKREKAIHANKKKSAFDIHMEKQMGRGLQEARGMARFDKKLREAGKMGKVLSAKDLRKMGLL